MNSTPKTGKRIVSRREYVARVKEKAYLSSVGAGLCLLCLACLLGICLVFWNTKTLPNAYIPFFMFLVITMVAGAVFTLHIGLRTVKEAKQINIGVLLTRANAADLPAPDSLVRASEEPLQKQRAELLRATTKGEQTPAEQLLRPVE